MGLAAAVCRYTDSGRGLLLLTCGLSHIELYVGLVAANALSKLKVALRAVAQAGPLGVWGRLVVDPRPHSVSTLCSDLRQPLMHSHRIYFSPQLSEDFEYRLKQSFVGPRYLKY